jgi:CO/xanthine dehydrogenase FAD-binding subunit
MRAFLPEFEAVSARSLVEALTLLAQDRSAGQSVEATPSAVTPVNRRWQPIAGGTDLMVLFSAGKLAAGRYLDIWGIDELRGITVAPSHIDLGALTTFTHVRQHSQLTAEFPSLVQAAIESGAIAIQNRGTLGGNIANASPAADSPPALLAYDAELELVSLRGVRWLPYAEFHTGYKQMQRAADELIARIRIPRLSPSERERQLHYYRKVGTRRAQAISKVCLAASVLREGDRLTRVRIGLGSVAPVPLRCRVTESVLESAALSPALLREAQSVLATEIAPIDDIRSTREYRRQVAQNLLADFVSRCQAV